MDKFTVDLANGNGDLTYPVGMLTADEILMAGNTSQLDNAVTTYLLTESYSFWSLSPFGFGDPSGSIGYPAATAFALYYDGLNGYPVSVTSVGVRASISLAVTAKLQGGDGSFKSPYLFDEPMNG